MSECFYDDEHHGDEEDAEDGRNGRTKDDGDAHRDSRCGAGAAGHGQWDGTDDEGQGRHDDRAETDLGRFDCCRYGIHAPFIDTDFRVFDDQDGVLGHQAHEHHQSDLEIDIVFQPADPDTQVGADAGHGESTTDMTFAGHNLIAENGSLLADTAPFAGEAAVTELDLGRMVQERQRDASAIYTLDALQVSCGDPLVPTATATISDESGEKHVVCATGTGPVDAAYKAVDQVVSVHGDLQEFSVKAVTRGIGALGEVTVRIQAEDGRVFTGRGSDNDIVVSSAKAYVNAINRMIQTQRSNEGK